MPELIWEGKYDDQGRLLGPPRVALPFQTIETVNQSAQERQTALEQLHAGQSGQWRNRLIWGDKKYVLPSLLAEFAGRVDLIYIDPPFATGADFSYQTPIHPDDDAGNGRLTLDYTPNLIEQMAYRDTWGGGLDTYLKWMFETLTFLRELLAESGSIYVHCDDHANHLIKVLMDGIFGVSNFRNEIAWKRSNPKNDAGQYGRSSDRLLFYSKSPTFTFEVPRLSTYSETTKSEWFNRTDDKGVYCPTVLTAPGSTSGDSGQAWRGIDPGTRHWAVPKVLTERYETETGNKLVGEVRERLDTLANAGYIDFNSNGSPTWRRYFTDSTLPPVQDMWYDNEVRPVARTSSEKANYPTQKPESLLERILSASSNPGDLVLDCFCGSGTTAAVAEKLGRRWIAADLGRFAIATTRKRLLARPEVQPFQVQNLGRYERQAWQSAELEQDYRAFICALYRAEPLHGYSWLHGVKGGRLVHIGGVDAPVALDDVEKVIAEFNAAGSGAAAGVDLLGWDFGLEVDTEARDLARSAGVSLRLLRIPREVMDAKAVAAGEIQFFELAALALEPSVNRRQRRVTLTLADFVMPPDGVPAAARQSVTHWSQWIDYWAVDWDYRGDTFNNQWQSYRTRQEPQLRRQAFHTYDRRGGYTIVVKVIDLLGNDTTRRLEVTL